jgi:superoxide dismutase, Fe-Mn family
MRLRGHDAKASPGDQNQGAPHVICPARSSLPLRGAPALPFHETLEFHHDKHHAGYVTNANTLLKDSGLEGKSLEKIVKETYGKNVPLFNNAAQHYNHSEYWKSIKPKGGGKVPGALKNALIAAFGSIEKVKQELVQAGTTQFGSGWAWLVVKDGEIAVAKTANAENPLLQGATPILTVDVWEHTYYIDYRNRRPDYLKAFVENLVNWDYVAERYDAAIKLGCLPDCAPERS